MANQTWGTATIFDMTITDTFPTVDAFYKALNAVRLAKSEQWIFVESMVADRYVILKTYGHTYLQRYAVDGVSQRLPAMDCKVSEWKQAIFAPFV
jgi:hypothetical protein